MPVTRATLGLPGRGKFFFCGRRGSDDRAEKNGLAEGRGSCYFWTRRSRRRRNESYQRGVSGSDCSPWTAYAATMHSFAETTTTTTKTMTQEDLIAGEWLAVTVVSLTVNACLLFRGILSRAVQCCVAAGHGTRSGHISWTEDCEGGRRQRSTRKNGCRCGEESVTA